MSENMVTAEEAKRQLAAAIAANAGRQGTLAQACASGFLRDLGKNRNLVERAMSAPVGSGLRNMYEKSFPLYRRLFLMIDYGEVAIPEAL